VVKGIKTTIPFHLKVMSNEHFLSGDITTDFIGDKFVLETAEHSENLRDVALVAAALQMGRRTRESVSVSGQRAKGMDAWRMVGRRSRWAT